MVRHGTGATRRPPDQVHVGDRCAGQRRAIGRDRARRLLTSGLACPHCRPGIELRNPDSQCGPSRVGPGARTPRRYGCLTGYGDTSLASTAAAVVSGRLRPSSTGIRARKPAITAPSEVARSGPWRGRPR
ncbi:DUF6233 domain-containing protein [Streptomyces iakyrus]|uniref:DUF6233 domain-containing protein n=1 Tax=Streptomyces iakyrus TaxID=68219 RepID=UPI0033BE5617